MVLKDLTTFLKEIKDHPVDIDPQNEISEWITVTYDIKGNQLRNEFREKLIRLGALYQNDSTYLVPKKIIRDNNGDVVDEMSDAERIIEAYGKDEDIKIFAIGMKIEVQAKIDSVSQAYKKQMDEWIEERKQKAKYAHEKLLAVLDEVKRDPREKKITGLHRIIKGLEEKEDDLQQLINRYGNDNDQFDISMIETYINKIKDTYDRIKEEKEIVAK